MDVTSFNEKNRLFIALYFLSVMFTFLFAIAGCGDLKNNLKKTDVYSVFSYQDIIFPCIQYLLTHQLL